MMTALFACAMSVMLQGNATFRMLDKGDQSNMDDGREAVARSAAEFSALWRLHAVDRPQPKIDFSREMVVAVFLGSRPSAGFAIDILGTKDEGGALVVQYRETRPAKGLIAAQMITSAYAIAAVPRREGTVKFERVE
jgi:hypothetical protein